MGYWHKWAKKHDIHELKEECGSKHRPDLGLLAEHGRKKKEMYDMNWADSKNCLCCEAEGTEKHRLHHCKE